MSSVVQATEKGMWYDKLLHKVERCPVWDACNSDLTCNDLLGYSVYDAQCLVCKVGTHYFEDATGTCEVCFSMGVAQYLSIAAVIIMFIAVVILSIRYGSSYLRCISALAAFLQVLPLIVGIGGPSVPPNLRKFIRAFSLINFEMDFLGPGSCFVPEWMTYDEFMIIQYAAFFAMPLLMLLLLRLVECCQRCKKPGELQRAKFKAARLQSTVVLLSIAYFPLVFRVVRAFTCKQDQYGRNLLPGSELECEGSAFAVVRGICIAGAILYSAGIPAYFMTIFNDRPVLLMMRAHLLAERVLHYIMQFGEISSKYQFSLSNRYEYENAMFQWLFKFSSLSLHYRFHVFYWELVTLSRRLMLIVLFLALRGLQRGIAIVAVLVVFQLLHTLYEPFVEPNFQTMESFGLSVQITLCVVMIIASASDMSAESDTGFVVGVACIAIIVSLLVSLFVYSFRASRTRSNRLPKPLRILPLLYPEHGLLLPSQRFLDTTVSSRLRGRRFAEIGDERPTNKDATVEVRRQIQYAMDQLQHQEIMIRPCTNQMPFCTECYHGATNFFKCHDQNNWIYTCYAEMCQYGLMPDNVRRTRVFACQCMRLLYENLVFNRVPEKERIKQISNFTASHLNPINQLCVSRKHWMSLCLQMGAVLWQSGAGKPKAGRWATAGKYLICAVAGLLVAPWSLEDGIYLTPVPALAACLLLAITTRLASSWQLQGAEHTMGTVRDYCMCVIKQKFEEKHDGTVTVRSAAGSGYDKRLAVWWPNKFLIPRLDIGLSLDEDDDDDEIGVGLYPRVWRAIEKTPILLRQEQFTASHTILCKQCSSEISIAGGKPNEVQVQCWRCWRLYLLCKTADIYSKALKRQKKMMKIARKRDKEEKRRVRIGVVDRLRRMKNLPGAITSPKTSVAINMSSDDIDSDIAYLSSSSSSSGESPSPSATPSEETDEEAINYVKKQQEWKQEEHREQKLQMQGSLIRRSRARRSTVTIIDDLLTELALLQESDD